MRRFLQLLLVLTLWIVPAARALDLGPLDRFESMTSAPAQTAISESTPDLEPTPQPTPQPTPTPAPLPQPTPAPDEPFFEAGIDGKWHVFTEPVSAYVSQTYNMPEIDITFNTKTPNGVRWYLLSLHVPAYAQQGDVVEVKDGVYLYFDDNLKRKNYYSGRNANHDDSFVRVEITYVSEDWSIYEGTLDALV